MKKDKKSKSQLEQEDYKTRYLRALADYQNLEKRIVQEKESANQNAVKHFVLKLLPFLDNLDKAEIFFKDEGLKMIKNQLLQSLKNEGVEEFALEGHEFDPQYAEAIEIVPGDKDNIIIEVLQKGYKFQDKVIRPAQVKVSKKI